MSRQRSSLAKRLAWFALLWAAGVAAVATVGAVLKIAIGA